MKKSFESIRVLGWCCQTSRAPMILCAILAVCLHTTGAVAQPGPTTVDPVKQAAWEKAQMEAGKKLADFNRAVKGGDPVQIRKSALELQTDPIAVQKLNQSGNTGLVNKHNSVVSQIKADTVEGIKQAVANEWNSKNPSKTITPDDVRVYEPTNYKNPDAQPKIGQDWDVTPQIKKPGTTEWVDVPRTQSQSIVEKAYYKAAGGEQTFEPAKTGAAPGDAAKAAAHKQSVEVTDKFSPDAYTDADTILGKDGAKPEYGKKLQDSEQIAKAIEHKSNLARNNASVETDPVKAVGQEVEQFRQSSKQYDNIAKPRVDEAGGKISSHVDKGMAIVRDAGTLKISPEEARAALAKMGETPDSIINKAAGQVEAAQKLKPTAGSKAAQVVGTAAVAVDVFSSAEDVKQRLKEGDTAGAARVAGSAIANTATLGLAGAAEANVIKGADRDAANADLANANATNSEAYKMQIESSLRKSGVNEKEAHALAEQAAAGNAAETEDKFKQLKITMPERIVEGPVVGDDTIFQRGGDVLTGLKDSVVKAGKFLKETGQDLWEIGSGLVIDSGVTSTSTIKDNAVTEITSNLKDGVEALTRHGDDRAMAEAAKAQIIEKLVAKGATPEGANKAAQAIIYGHDPEPLRNLNQLLDQKTAAQNGETKPPTTQPTTPKNTTATTPAKTATTTTPQATSPTTKTGAGTTTPNTQKTAQTVASAASQVGEKVDAAARQKLAQTVASAASSVAQKAENNQIVREGETHTGRGGTITTKDGTTRMDYVDDGKGGTKLVISDYDNDGNLLNRERENSGGSGQQPDQQPQGGDQHTGRGGTITTSEGKTQLDYIQDEKGGTKLVISNFDNDGNLLNKTEENVSDTPMPDIAAPEVPEPEIPDTDMPEPDAPEPPKVEEQPRRENTKMIKQKVPSIVMSYTYDDDGNITGSQVNIFEMEILMEVPWNTYEGETDLGLGGGATSTPTTTQTASPTTASPSQTTTTATITAGSVNLSAKVSPPSQIPVHDAFGQEVSSIAQPEMMQRATIYDTAGNITAQQDVVQIGSGFYHPTFGADGGIESFDPFRSDQRLGLNGEMYQNTEGSPAIGHQPTQVGPEIYRAVTEAEAAHFLDLANQPENQASSSDPNSASEEAPASTVKGKSSDTSETPSEAESAKTDKASSGATKKSSDTMASQKTETAVTTKKEVTPPVVPTRKTEAVTPRAPALDAAKQAAQQAERDAAQQAAKTAAQQAAKTASQQAARQAAQSSAQQAARAAATEAGRSASKQAAKAVDVPAPPPPPPPRPPHHHP